MKVNNLDRAVKKKILCRDLKTNVVEAADLGKWTFCSSFLNSSDLSKDTNIQKLPDKGCWEDSHLQKPFNLQAEILSSVVEGKFGICSLFDYKAVATFSGDFPEISQVLGPSFNGFQLVSFLRLKKTTMKTSDPLTWLSW